VNGGLRPSGSHARNTCLTSIANEPAAGKGDPLGGSNRNPGPIAMVVRLVRGAGLGEWTVNDRGEFSNPPKAAVR